MNLVILLLLSCAAFFVRGEDCTAVFNIFTQPPNWPNGLNAQFSVQVDNSALVGGWVINFTAKGYGPLAPFNISSSWNSGSVSVQDNGDNTFSYSITNAAYNAQFPSYIGFNAETYLPHPRNAICGLSINNIPCSLSVSPAVLPPVVPSASILLNYEYYNAGSTNLPLLVLVHGITENMQSWDPLISLFTPYYRVLAVDLRGHGNSQNTPNKADYYFENLAADVYNTVVTVVGNDDLPLMVGHSLGGLVVTAYGSVFPVRGVICVDQSMDLSFFQGTIQAAEPALSGDNGVFLATISFLFSTLYGSLSQSEVARLEALRNPVQNVVLGVWAPLFDLTSAELSTLVDETMQYPGGTAYLAIFGANPGAEYQNWLEERIPGAVSELWGELGHYPHLIYPSQFVQRVRDFDAAATQQLCV